MAKTYQGKPCKRAGHTERYVSNANCVVCSNEYTKGHNPTWQAENRDKIKVSHKKYQLANLNYYRYLAALRRANIKRLTPKCVSLEVIKAFYIDCPDGYEVDHIVPISKGGLHMLSNFQYLTAYDNKVKGAKI